MKRAATIAVIMTLAATPVLGSCSSLNETSSCFSRSHPSLPTPDKVRAHLSNGQKGREIYDAVMAGDLDTLEQLVRSDPQLLSTHRVLAQGEAPSNGNSGGLLTFAIASCNPEMIGALLELGADPDGTPAGLPLTLAALADDPLMATMLVQAGANPDAQTEYTAAPLREVLYFERANSAALLLRAGANPNRADAIGGTPLEAALTFADYPSAEVLLNAGANPWQVGNKGTLPAALLLTPIKTGGDEALRQKLLARVQETAPMWPPPSQVEVRDGFLSGRWPTEEMRRAGMVATPKSMASMKLAQSAAK